MRKANLPDCTLRDGGCRNNWDFGENAISQVIQGIEKDKIGRQNGG